MITVFGFLIGLSTSPAFANCPPQDVDRRSVERINERYDDFFRVQRDREERLGRAQVGADQVREQRAAQKQKLEDARKDYARVPKDEAREERLRIEWEASQKQRVAKLEEARKCEVAKRDADQQLLQRGRKIPELKEFDLEDY